MEAGTATVTALPGGGDKPRWAPAWLPTAATLDYIQKLVTIVLIALAALYFVGFRSLKPFAHHIAQVER